MGEKAKSRIRALGNPKDQMTCSFWEYGEKLMYDY